MQNQPVAKIIIDLLNTVNGNIEGAANAEITIGIQHVFQLVHRVVHDEFPVVISLEKIQSAIAKKMAIVCFGTEASFCPCLPGISCKAFFCVFLERLNELSMFIFGLLSLLPTWFEFLVFVQ